MDQTKTLFLIRGVQRSGKTTLARHLAPFAYFAADDFFTDADGTYRWDSEKIVDAHEFCQMRTEVAMVDRQPVIAVHNTFAKLEHLQPYHDLAKRYGYRVSEIVCTGEFEENGHNVPAEAIERTRQGFEWRQALGTFPGTVRLQVQDAAAGQVAITTTQPIQVQTSVLTGKLVLSVRDANGMLGGFDGASAYIGEEAVLNPLVGSTGWEFVIKAVGQ